MDWCPDWGSNPAEPAINLIGKAEEKEEEISGAYQETLAQQLGIDFDASSEPEGDGAQQRYAADS